MARFFFDIREGCRFISDEEGLEFSDIAAAEYEAARAAADIGRDLLPKGDLRTIVVEVRGPAWAAGGYRNSNSDCGAG
jgi:hypothetical protein